MVRFTRRRSKASHQAEKENMGRVDEWEDEEETSNTKGIQGSLTEDRAEWAHEVDRQCRAISDDLQETKQQKKRYGGNENRSQMP